MMPRDAYDVWNKKLRGGAPPATSTIYTEEGQRGRAKFRVTFDIWGGYQIDVWYGCEVMNNAGTISINYSHIPMYGQKRRRTRGLRRADKILRPVIKLWADSDFKYSMDLKDFVTTTLGKDSVWQMTK